MAWQTPKTDYAGGYEPTAVDFNRAEGNTKYNYDVNKVIAAGGTATAITLSTGSNIALTNGLRLTFKAAANNSAAATTVNVDGTGAKSLYKPGGTDAPNLIAGKAYTIWYDSSGGNFFVQASAEGDAEASHVLAGKKFSNASDTDITGTMPNRGAANYTPGTSDQYIADGYHNGGGKVYSLGGNAAVANVLAGKTFSSNVAGRAQNGHMPNRAGDTAALAISRSGTTIKLRPPEGYYDGADDNVTYTDNDWIEANIRQGKDIFGKTGTFTSDATAESGDILSGKTAYVNGNKVTGTFKAFTPGDYVISQEMATTVATYSTSYTKVRQFTIYHYGEYRVVFGIRRFENANIVYGRIYRNGVAVGTERSSASTLTVNFSEDIEFNAGDTCEVWIKSDNGEGVACDHFLLKAAEGPVHQSF